MASRLARLLRWRTRESTHKKMHTGSVASTSITVILCSGQLNSSGKGAKGHTRSVGVVVTSAAALADGAHCAVLRVVLRLTMDVVQVPSTCRLSLYLRGKA